MHADFATAIAMPGEQSRVRRKVPTRELNTNCSSAFFLRVFRFVGSAQHQISRPDLTGRRLKKQVKVLDLMRARKMR